MIPPVNYAEDLQIDFLDKSSFILNRFERQEKVADQLFEYRDTLPALFDGVGWGASHPQGDLDLDLGLSLPLTPHPCGEVRKVLMPDPQLG